MTLLLLHLLLLGGCGHSIRPEFAPNYPDRSFDFANPPCQLSAKPDLGASEVAIRYLDEANGWISLKDPEQNDLPIRFLKVPSQHAPHFWGIHLSKGEIAKDWENGWETYRLHSLREGKTFAFVIDLRSPDLKTTVFRIYYQDAASPPDQGIPRLTGDDGKPGFDLAVLCMASYYIVRKQPETILAALHPRHVLVTHYENFFRDTRKSVEFVPLLTNYWANRFFVRARRVLNLWESQTAGPAGPVCGPSDRHWTMPMPGEWVKFRVR